MNHSSIRISSQHYREEISPRRMKQLLGLVLLSFYIVAATSLQNATTTILRSIDDDYIIQSATQGDDGVYYEPADLNFENSTTSIEDTIRDILKTTSKHTHKSHSIQSILPANTIQAKKAAHIAQTVFGNRRILLRNLEKEAERAYRLLKTEISQLEFAQKSVLQMQSSADQAKNHVSVLKAALKSAQEVDQEASESAKEAHAELTSQTKLVDEVKQNLESLNNKLKDARNEYETTKYAAAKATIEAQNAQKRAQEAGNKASRRLFHSTIKFTSKKS